MKTGWLIIALWCFSMGADAQGSAANADVSAHEFHIGRMVFSPHAGSSWGPGRPWWAIDWPEAEEHFTAGVTRYTHINIAPDSRHIALDDPALFDHPWLLAQQVGRWYLSDSEVLHLREYLLRGGFLVVDDFHGPAQWAIFERVIKRVFPARPIKRIPETDQLMHIMYELDQSTQIPGRRHLRRGPAGIEVHMPDSPSQWWGIYDDAQRLVVAINFNMDMGDAWEHADDPVYPLAMTALAYRYGINYIIYAMTH